MRIVTSLYEIFSFVNYIAILATKDSSMRDGIVVVIFSYISANCV